MPGDVDAFFLPGGPLARHIAGYEPRQGQLAVARAVAAAMQSQKHVMIEAGTGTGKTLAYLVPALQSGLKVVVSTGTKNLQEQIVGKDLPLLRRALERSIDVEVMKGRSNYLCEARAEMTLAQLALPGIAGREILEEVRAWRNHTQTGDRCELASLGDESPLWRDLSVTSEQCMGRACDHYENCWVTQMRRRAQNVSLVIVNHHLYLADAALRKTLGDDTVALLPPHDFVIFDEAHELDEIAAQHFGIEVSQRRLLEFEQDVRIFLMSTGSLRERLQGTLQNFTPQSARLFDALPFGLQRHRLHPHDLTEPVLQHHQDLDAALQRFEIELSLCNEEQAKVLGTRATTLGSDLATALGLQRPGQQGREAIADGDDQAPNSVDYVRFTQGTGAGRSLVARPVDVGPMLQAVVRNTKAAFVSATLRISGSFDHFSRRIGLVDATQVVADSPFDYAKQASFYVADDLPEPDAPDFASSAAQRTKALVDASGGGAFVLCTSHRMLSIMQEALIGERGRRILVQGTAPRGLLLQRFMNDGNAVLIATMSFWKGVDVPGRALRLVVIDRLPFASPSDPVVEARVEHLRRIGVDPFINYQLPHTALILRQGFGRLIRRQSDRGMVALLDRRVTSKRYGPLLLKSLPNARRITDLQQALAACNDLHNSAST